MIPRDTLTEWACVQERESTCARRDMEQLRLEYLAREERFMLDGDRNELRTIKQELDELRYYTPCLLYTSPSPRDRQKSRMPSSA